MKDFFISYNKADELWAIGFASWLDQAGFAFILQAQHFVAGTNFVSAMHGALKEAERLIMVLSPDYLSAKFPESEWTAAFAKDPTNENHTLIPVRVRECYPDGLLKPIAYIDLVGLSEQKARGTFLSEIMATLEGQRPSSAVAQTPAPEARQSTFSQVATGNKNIQVAGDYHHYEKPRIEKKIIQPREGAISPAQRLQVLAWIESLAENTVGMARKGAFGMWWKRFKTRFKVDKYEELLASDMPGAAVWYRQQMAIGTRGLKSKAPDQWRTARIVAIKAAMRDMGADKQTYYSELSVRLKMRTPFSSLNDLTKRDLERVYSLVLRDARGGK
jgi:hypothetical protein